jgi:anaerobic magnesium-protoporphyrin IX monomethyl ester cyclase
MKIHCVLPSSPWLADSKTNIPLGPLYLASSLRGAGHEVVVTSLLGRGHNDPVEFQDAVIDADVHLVSFCTPQFNEALEIASVIKDKNPNAVLVAGGPHATHEPHEVGTATRQKHYHVAGPLRARRNYSTGVGGPLFDAVVSGEGELIIHKVLDDLGHLQRYYDGNEMLPDVNQVPYPAWDLLPSDHIHNDGAAVMKQSYFPGGVMSLIGTRGCPFHCTFCSGPRIGIKPRFRSPENIIGEMRSVIEMGVRQFKFQDDTMTCSRPRVAALANAMESEFGDSYAARYHTRVNVMDDDMASHLKRMQAKVLCFGFESGSQTVLDACNKRTTVEQGTAALRVAKAHGFFTVAFLVFGLPGETRSTMHETMRWLASVKADLNSCNLAVAIPYPGSQLWKEPARNGIEIMNFNYDDQWIVGFASRDELLVRPLGVSLGDMLAMKREMFEFMIGHGWAKPEWKADAQIQERRAS